MPPSQPIATLPHYLNEYGFPDNEAQLLTWAQVSARLAAPKNYWICTVSPTVRRTHARPIWGVWVDETLFFGGAPYTAWSRNLQANPLVSVHLEDGTQPIILDGEAVLVDDETLMNRLDDAYEAKYNIRHGPPIWQLIPERAFAWHDMHSVTRFIWP